jgi:hypothetical protein
VGVFEGMDGLVCIADPTGHTKLFHLDNHKEVNPFKRY